MTLPVFELITGADNPFDHIEITTIAPAPVFVDLDNDEDQDLVIGDYEGYLYYYFNDNGDWVEQTGTNNPFNGFRKGGYLVPALIDIEGDGDQDLLAGDFSGNITFLLNDDGTFVEKTGSDNPFESIDFVHQFPDPTFSDVDDDNDQDLIIGEAYGSIKLYRNDNGNFVEVTGEDNPFNSINVQSFPKPTFMDMDKDGDKDLLVGNHWGSVFYYQNDDGVFVRQTGVDNPLSIIDLGQIYLSPAVIDVDNDGNEDVVVGTGPGNLVYYRQLDENEFVGTPDADSLEGTSTDDLIRGLAGNDTLIGNEGNDVLKGGAGEDELLGNDGQDVLVGAEGDDILTGGNNQDYFTFNSPNDGTDTIEDFNPNEDIIRISQNGFGAGLNIGILPASKFVLGTAAGDSNDRFIYNPNNGDLFFDNNGSGNGGTFHLATLEGAPNISANNILI